MPLPRPPGSVAPPQNAPSLFHSVRTFWRVLLANLHTRLELFTTELEEEAVRLAYMVGAGIVGIMALHGAFFFAMLWLLALVWGTAARLWVIGGIFLIYAMIGGGCLFYASRLITGRPKFLSQTITELKKDAEGLQSSIKTGLQEEKP